MTDIDAEVVDDLVDESASSPWARRLIGAALDLSAAAVWAQARYEWAVVRYEDHGLADETCVCGYEGVRYLSTVANRATGAVLYPVGSCCVTRFESAEMQTQLKSLQALARLSTDARAGRLSHASVSRRAIDELYRQGVIDDRACRILRRGFEAVRRGHGRVDDPALFARVVQVMRDVVFPHLTAGPTATDEGVLK